LKKKQQNEQRITALYARLSRDDEKEGISGSIANQELLCKGWFLPPNTYDCGSFVVNGTAVIGKE
jgi:predicted site-specific integrase-resolvase